MLGEKNMFNILKATPSETANTSDHPAESAQGGFRRFGKKPYVAAIAVVAIAIIAVAFFIPQGGATIPLSVDYVVGEKMVYDNTLTMATTSYNLGSKVFATPNSTTMNMQQTIEVVGFDGENYLLNDTFAIALLGRPLSFTLTEKMNKTGYSTYLLNMGSTQTEVPKTGLSSNSYLAQLLSKPEVKVGDSISIPYPTTGSSVQTTGELTIKFNGPEDLTVPAGTYKAFRIDMTSSNLKMNLNSSTNASSIILPKELSISMNITSSIYLEYGTMRQIKSTMQETSFYQSSTLNMTYQMTMDMTLKQHTKP
jgi:hypothetical protein